MAYFQPSIDAEGIHIPTYEDILGYLMTQYRSIFGEDVYLGMDSKDYQMLSVLARSMDDYAALAVDAYNARSPLYATGDSLDVLCTVVGIIRRPAESGVASLTLTGTDGTQIPAGSKVVDADGGLWSLTEDCEIASGTATASATKDDPGACNLVAGYITTIYTPVVGWYGVTNTTTGTVGKDTETDEALRARMRVTLMSNTIALTASMENAIKVIDGVEDVKVVVNDTDSTDDMGIPSHSICPIVYGGDAQEIAQAIFDTKPPGIGLDGGVTKTVVDGYGQEQTVKFSRPDLNAIEPTIYGTVYDHRVDLDALKSQIQTAIFNYVNNECAIGESLMVNRLYAVIYSSIQANGVAITNITITDTGGTHTDVVELDWDGKNIISAIADVDVSNIEFDS